ncbi:flagellar biosynthesis protein FlhB [Candidatus Endobugula sertula]|uniref:Flagellar biosynthetic protein FlhB n=1 Tax=Candidatus Endobugula sertula TaxID=62101 RepID=A0A1D2QN37_9GAMM|nr:flagellar biosynthesis protein FlhB [Candidatus Endobugula sertula]
MADNDQSQEKTEEATPRKLEKAREDGQAPRSKELTTTTVLLAGSLGLLWFGDFLSRKLIGTATLNFSLPREAAFDTRYMLYHLGMSLSDALLGMMPIFGILVLAAILGPVALGGWLFSIKAMMPKMSRMNPLEGIKRMFSVKSLMELAKALGKVLVILLLAILLLHSMQQELMDLAYENTQAAIIHSMEMGAWAAIALSLATIFIAIIDVPFQIWDNAKKLKMTVQDVRDETKDSEGKPEVKGRIRKLQQEIASRQMLAAVPDADVVITNPTHYAVAVKYKPESMNTPIVVAKGVDKTALKIREIAGVNKVDIVESPVLARSIYYTTQLDEEIPSGLYIAVAKILAYVFQLRNFRQGLAKRPTYPRVVDVPDDLYFDP